MTDSEPVEESRRGRGEGKSSSLSSSVCVLDGSGGATNARQVGHRCGQQAGHQWRIVLVEVPASVKFG